MTTSQDRIPHLTRDGESIWRLEDFEALIGAGDPVIHDNMARASRAFKALQAYAEDYAGRCCEAEHLITDLLNDLHHLSDAYGVSWETALCVADANYTDEVD